MGEIFPPKPVLPIVATSSRYPCALSWAQERLAERFEVEVVASPAFDFNQTDYYESSMGENLKKQFFAPMKLFDPEFLAAFKVETNVWEDDYVSQQEAPEARPLNLDPGYITEDKLVLASTKNHAHRLYLSEGIYAEITLQYRAKQWQSFLWTYPDYREPAFHAFFDICRGRLRKLLRERD